LSRQAQARVADASALAGECFNGIQTVQAYRLEVWQQQRYNAAVDSGFATAVARTRVRAALLAAADTAVFVAIVAVLWAGVRQVQAGALSPGELGQFLLLAGMAGAAMAALSEVAAEVQRAAGAMERLAEWLHATPAIVAPPQPVPLPSGRPCGLSFHDVWFEYPARPGHMALQGLTLDIAPGEHVAFVGPSGSGKSTALALLMRFHDPVRGQVRLGGVDLASADPSALRERIGLVPQDSLLFGASLHQNILLGRPGASTAQVRAAAQAAAVDSFVPQLPQGYETPLGERGAHLSGGQRQRVALARALLMDPPVLLLDEATSALDAHNEAAVLRALGAGTAPRTTVLVAHRLATARTADRIVVFDQGRVLAQGSHAHLLAHCPLYAGLAALQGAAQPASAGAAPLAAP
jgi:ATP-binding cassette subfamily B protein